MSKNLDGEILGWHYASRKAVRVKWDKGILTAVEEVAHAPQNVWLAPALVDLQVNGFAGIDFQQDNLSPEDLLKATNALRNAACGGFFITLITDEWDRILGRLEHLRQLRAQSSQLTQAILGWHIEGPFLSEEPGYCGAHNAKLMRDPTSEMLRALRRIAGDDPLLLTIAPERRGAIQAIAEAVSLGMKVNLGHTNASAEIISKALEAGATAFTHLANGCPRQLDRHDNILWRIFEIAGQKARAPLNVTLIPDKIHVSPALFRLMHRVFPNDSIFYVTDAMAAAGAAPGRYTLGALELEVGADQVVRLPGQPNFAGSALRPIEGVIRATEMLGLPWQEVWRHSSEIPAQYIGLDVSLRTGNPARFCVVETAPKGVISAKVIA